jgi:Mlc titration factor MtfA (ptsG expression regulator)
MGNWFTRLFASPPPPFPPAWREILRNRVPLYERLVEADQEELESHVQWFLEEKRFEGCGGLEITDELRVTIAGQACLLLLHQARDGYAKLKSILVYPSTYFAGDRRDDNGNARLGESWEHGTVVLAWDSVLGGATNPFDGRNVVLHEFAHQLDQEDGEADGAPVLARGERFLHRHAAYTSWARVLSSKFEQLQEKTRRGRKTVMDKYGATHPAEFFAVATECFFEKPRQMLKKHPELYEELKQFYQQDPAGWAEAPALPPRAEDDGER